MFVSVCIRRPPARGACLAALLIFSACSPTTTPQPGPLQSRQISHDGGVMVAQPEVMFYDADAFDTTLGQTFADLPAAVRVSFAAPPSLNALPPRLNVWLTEVKKSDGRIKMASKDQTAGGGTRGLGIGMVFDIVDAIITIQERQARATQLAGARGYDATIIYDKTTGTAKEVLFQRRGI